MAHVCDHKVEMESDGERRRLTRVYECSDTVEQRMNSGGRNDERLTDIHVDTRNCYICKVAQYLASRKGLLRAFMYALVNIIKKDQQLQTKMVERCMSFASLLFPGSVGVADKPGSCPV